MKRKTVCLAAWEAYRFGDKGELSVIREFNPSEINEIMQIWLDTNIHTHHFVERSYWLSHYDEVKRALTDSELLVYGKGVPMGFAGMEGDHLSGLFVAAKFQHHGVGSALLKECKRRHPVMNLAVYAKNDRAVNFYLNRGFTISQEQINCDTGEQEYIMTWSRDNENPEGDREQKTVPGSAPLRRRAGEHD